MTVTSFRRGPPTHTSACRRAALRESSVTRFRAASATGAGSISQSSPPPHIRDVIRHWRPHLTASEVEAVLESELTIADLVELERHRWTISRTVAVLNAPLTALLDALTTLPNSGVSKHEPQDLQQYETARTFCFTYGWILQNPLPTFLHLSRRGIDQELLYPFHSDPLRPTPPPATASSRVRTWFASNNAWPTYRTAFESFGRAFFQQLSMSTAVGRMTTKAYNHGMKESLAFENAWFYAFPHVSHAWGRASVEAVLRQHKALLEYPLTCKFGVLSKVQRAAEVDPQAIGLVAFHDHVILSTPTAAYLLLCRQPVEVAAAAA